MKMALSAQALRIIGSLLEKQVTTPELYPLSLNALVSACNQKTNREPVMNLSEADVQAQLDALEKKHLVTANSGFGQRVSKYEQRFCNSAFGNMRLNSAEVAVLTLLFLRGAQTPGELRSRSGRLHAFNDVEEVEHTLAQLSARDEGPMVVRLAREPGKRECRYMHLFGDEETVAPDAEHDERPGDDDTLAARVAQLEATVQRMQLQLQQLLNRES